MKKNTLTIQDWLRTRPYKSPTKNDQYYFGVTKEIYDILESEFDWFEEIFEEEAEGYNMMRMLAVILASYFEDYAAEVGFWKAFTDTHHERFGRYLPFYDLTEYDPEYLNIQDIQYLIWHFVSKLCPNYVFDPAHTIITSLAEEVLDYLDEELDNALVTDQWEKYLSIEDDIDLFALREKLSWFSHHHYLLGMDFLPEFVVAAADLREKLDREMPGRENDNVFKAMIYDIEQSFYFDKRTSFMAMTAPQWFSKVVRCSDKTRNQIADLHLHKGIYLIKTNQKETIQCEYVSTGRLYEVSKSSMDKILPVKLAVGDHLVMNIVEWNGLWHQVGIMTTNDKSVEELRKLPIEDIYFYDEAQLLKAQETTNAHEQAFLELFGTRWVISENVEEINQKYRDWAMYFWEKTPHKTSDREAERGEYRAVLAKMNFIDLKPIELDEHTDFGLFFEPNIGVMATLSMQATIDALQAAEPTKEEIKTAYFGITRDVEHTLGKYLIQTYGAQNFRFPFNSTISAVDNLDYIHIFEFPNDMGPPCPNVTMVSMD